MPYLVCVLFFFAQLLSFQTLSNRSEKPLKVLCMGDSITEGRANLNPHSYRYDLWKKMVDKGITVDFLGTVKDKNKYEPYKDQTFDAYNEGHSGWSSKKVDNDLKYWLKLEGYTPDVVLLHIGTNDFRIKSGHNPFVQVGQALASIDSIIKKLQEQNPAVIIYLAKIIPHASYYDKVFSLYTRTLNAAIEEAFEQKNEQFEGGVFIVDHHTGFTDDNFLEDGTHPSEVGAAKMADNWYSAMLPFLEDVIAKDAEKEKNGKTSTKAKKKKKKKGKEKKG